MSRRAWGGDGGVAPEALTSGEGIGTIRTCLELWALKVVSTEGGSLMGTRLESPGCWLAQVPGQSPGPLSVYWGSSWICIPRPHFESPCHR